MRIPSRLLPALKKQPASIGAFLAMDILLVGIGVLLFTLSSKAPWACAAAIALMALWSVHATRKERRRLRTLAGIIGHMPALRDAPPRL